MSSNFIQFFPLSRTSVDLNFMYCKHFVIYSTPFCCCDKFLLNPIQILIHKNRAETIFWQMSTIHFAKTIDRIKVSHNEIAPNHLCCIFNACK